MYNEEICVSVLVLTYNHRKYIDTCLNSILNQKTTFFYEILIGDDASSDGTSEVVQSYAQRYPGKIRAYVRTENLGATQNLYNLFQRAEGIFIANCEGDDYWTSSNKLQTQVDFLMDNSRYSGCTHDCLVIEGDGMPAKNQEIGWVCKKSHYKLNDFKGRYLSGQPSTLMHRNFFKYSDKDYSIIYAAHPMIADRTIGLILALEGDLCHMPLSMSCYRCVLDENGTNATSAIFVKKDDNKLVDYRLTLALERYAYDCYNVSLCFREFRTELLIKAIIKFILKPTKGRLACVTGIVQEIYMRWHNYGTA